MTFNKLNWEISNISSLVIALLALGILGGFSRLKPNKK